MNKDLIVKLAKLANNNPNDNEANAAARKVCRLLAESNFDFGSSITIPPKQYTGAVREDPIYKSYWYSNYNWNPDYWNEPKKEKEKKERKCNVCGKVELTARVTAVFVCNNCEWTAYQRNKEQAEIHRCICGRKQWVYHPSSALYVCVACGSVVTEKEATNNQWRMV
jgi:hypothetical protein